jgi:simple sugar transport system permease protein
VVGLVIVLVGVSPWQVLGSMVWGAFGSVNHIARVIATLVPLLLCSSGLMFTFTAGLYNLGIEGQIAFGAIAAMLPIRLFETAMPVPFVIALILAGAVGGMLWGLLAGVRFSHPNQASNLFVGVSLAFEIQCFHFLLHAGVRMVKAFLMQLLNLFGTKA